MSITDKVDKGLKMIGNTLKTYKLPYKIDNLVDYSRKRVKKMEKTVQTQTNSISN